MCGIHLFIFYCGIEVLLRIMEFHWYLYELLNFCNRDIPRWLCKLMRALTQQSALSFHQSAQRLDLCSVRNVSIRFKCRIILLLFVVCIYLLFSSEITVDSSSEATLGLLSLSPVAKQQVMSLRVSESNIRNGCLDVGCTQFKMNLIWKGLLPLDRRGSGGGCVK